MKIYGDIKSGNCYKVKLIADLVGIDYQWQSIDILKGETQTASFLARNPNGKIPLVEFEDGQILTESNAILFYLAQESDFWPSDSFAQAKVMQWMFFEQYSHEPSVAVCRFIRLYQNMPQHRLAEYESKLVSGYKALDIMENQLSKTQFIAGDVLTIADIALFAYTHVAEEGGFDLSKFSAINQWIERIKNAPNFSPMSF